MLIPENFKEKIWNLEFSSFRILISIFCLLLSRNFIYKTGKMPKRRVMTWELMQFHSEVQRHQEILQVMYVLPLHLFSVILTNKNEVISYVQHKNPWYIRFILKAYWQRVSFRKKIDNSFQKEDRIINPDFKQILESNKLQ